jgi:hypothetical protein
MYVRIAPLTGAAAESDDFHLLLGDSIRRTFKNLIFHPSPFKFFSCLVIFPFTRFFKWPLMSTYSRIASSPNGYPITIAFKTFSTNPSSNGVSNNLTNRP